MTSYLPEAIKTGEFFIRGGGHSHNAEAAENCRKNTPPSLWRAENDPVTKAHRELHNKDPKKL